MGWKPIATAPKDGTIFLAWNGSIEIMQFWDGSEYDEESMYVYADEVLQDVDPCVEQPTHWMPLPKPPTI